MKTYIRLPVWIPVTKILWLPTGTWWKRFWWAIVMLLLAIGLVLAILIPVHCGSGITPVPVPVPAPTAPAPVPEALAPTTPAPTNQPVPVSITNEEFREFLRIVFPGFAREITRHFYFPTNLSEVPLLLRDQKGELEIGYWWYDEKEDQKEEIVLVYDQGKAMIYSTDPFEKIGIGTIEKKFGKVVFP